MPIIEVSHLTKEYRLGAMHGLKQTLLNSAAKLAGKPVKERPLFKALDDVSFSIEQGEVVGIIGHNGAGKSTLLKMLARISTPTSGEIKVNGRIAPLIEVGAGFVPDFTGRENVYLNGSIMGLSKKEIDRKFDQIVAFAEMEKFIDTPVKRYSSGMQVKLAFAVATSIEAEILIVDEVLAVGDLAFQRKCFDRMESLIKKEGRTVLLVSHNIRQIERMCARVILLSSGKVLMDRDAGDVCNYFYEQSDKAIIANQIVAGRSSLVSSGEIEILQVSFVTGADRSTKEIEYLKPAVLRLVLKANVPVKKPMIFVGFHTTDFVYLTASSSGNQFRNETLGKGEHEMLVKFAAFPLLPGAYSMRVSVDVEDPIKNILYGDGVFHFSVVSHGIQRSSPQCGGGFFAIDTDWALNGEENLTRQQS